MYIKVKVKTKMKREEIKKVKSDHYDISLREEAKNNKANDRILEIFREIYPNVQIKIISGHHSPSKILSVDTETQ